MTEPRIFHLLHLSHRAVFRAADQALNQRFGVTAAQQAALMFLGEKDAASMSELAAALGLKAAATSGLVDRMEKNGFLERRTAPDDGRSYRLYLLEKGRALLKDSKQLVKDSNDALLEGFDEATRKQVATFLETIIERADAVAKTDAMQTKGKDNE